MIFISTVIDHYPPVMTQRTSSQPLPQGNTFTNHYPTIHQARPHHSPLAPHPSPRARFFDWQAMLDMLRWFASAQIRNVPSLVDLRSLGALGEASNGGMSCPGF